MTTIAALPPFPSRSQDAPTYIINADATMSALPTAITQFNTVAGEVNANVVAAANSATGSATSATSASNYSIAAANSAAAAAVSTGVAAWVTSTVYALYVIVISTIDFQNYRRSISSGTPTTVDPSIDTAGWRLLGFIKPWVIKISNYTAVNGDRIMANTSAGLFVITAPPSPAAGWRIQVKDYANTFGTNKITFDGNGANVEGLASTPVDITTKGWSGGFEYIDVTMGWKLI